VWIRYIFVLILSVQLLLVNVWPHVAHASTEEPEIQADSGVLMDMKTGQVLWSKNPEKHHYPASITKILTAILALENSKLDEPVRTSQLATEQEGNRVYLVEGEEEPMKEMLYGLLLNSGNDAAVAIAEHVAGTEENFANMMNEKAREIGATHSHFVTPNGLHDPDHYTTAQDMALIARYAMQNETFRQIVSTKYYPWKGKQWQSELVNLNKILWTYDGANGIKTGFTDQAHQTIVASAKRGDQEFLVCLMYGLTQQSIRDDASKLLDYGFNNFTTRTIAKKGESVTRITYKDDVDTDVLIGNDVTYTFRKDESAPVERVLHVQKPVPPFSHGTVLGTIEFEQAGKVIASAPLVAAKDVPKLHSAWLYVLPAFPLFLFGWIWYRLRLRTFRSKRIQNQNYYQKSFRSTSNEANSGS
jgi:D-alanyl-D-alanine carboxypeptidase (penicillin-binding protein 5/6)